MPRAIHLCPLPSRPFFTKIDLKDAFYHSGLSPKTRPLTSFRKNGVYYQYMVLPFGIRPAPFLMQSLATAMARKARVRGLWAWSHLDNLLLAHDDFSFLERQTTLFVQDLTRCGFRINPADSQFTPTPTIIFGGFFLNGPNECMAHTPSRYRDLLQTLALKVPQTTKSTNGWRAFGPFIFLFTGPTTMSCVLSTLPRQPAAHLPWSGSSFFLLCSQPFPRRCPLH